MSGQLPEVENTIKSYLCKSLSLASHDQITRTDCKGIGFQSGQSSYEIATGEGKKIGIFIKTFIPESNELSKSADKEVLMYEELLPAVIKFIKHSDIDLAKQVQSCFVKCYGLCQKTISTSGRDSLLLEDWSYRENFEVYTVRKLQDLEVRKEYANAVVSKLALIHGAFYAWQMTTYPGVSPDEMKAKYPALINYPFVVDSLGFENMLTGVPPKAKTGAILQMMNMVVLKVIRSHIVDFVEDPSKQANIIQAFERLSAISSHIPTLFKEIRDQKSQFICPVLGDVSNENIAFSTDHSGRLIFYDFGITGLTSPFMDLHWFIGIGRIQGYSDDLTNDLLDLYVTQFKAVAEKLGVAVERDDLINEFYATKVESGMVSMMFATFAFFFMLKREAKSEEKVSSFIRKVASTNRENEKNIIRDEVKKVMGQEMLQRVLFFMLQTQKHFKGHLDEFEKMISE